MYQYKILVSSQDIEMIEILDESRHLSSLQQKYPGTYDIELYKIYRDCNVYKHKLLDELYANPLFVTDKSFPNSGVDHDITCWTTDTTARDKRGRALDIVVYSSTENLSGEILWEPVVEQEFRTILLERKVDQINKLKETVKFVPLQYKVTERRFTNYPNSTWGYIAGRRHPMGPFQSSGMISANKAPHYTIWFSDSYEFEIVKKEE